jgi:hypothetical protein
MNDCPVLLAKVEGHRMTTPGDFIGPYRVLAEISRRASNVTYLVEHPAQGAAVPAFLTIWPEIHLREASEDRAFIQACQEIKELQAAAFPLLESGLEQEVPYIVLAEHEASQEEGIALLDRRLQDRTVTKPVASVEASPAPPKWRAVIYHIQHITHAFMLPLWVRAFTWARAFRNSLGTRRGRIWAGAVVALVVMLVSIFVSYQVLPASSATVTLTPRSVHLQHDLQVIVFTQPDQQGDIPGHFISYTTPTQTGSGPATGVIHHNATLATGQVVVSDITLNDPNSPANIGSSTIDSNSGVSITLQPFTATQGGTVTVSASAGLGANGNIPAYDIDFPVNLCQSSFLSPFCTQIGSAYVQNPQPFTGGSDAYDQHFVQASDIDTAAQPLIDQLTVSAQTMIAQLVTQQMQPGDQTVMPTPRCTPTSQSDQKIGDYTDSVTVQVSVTCYQITYAQKDFMPGVIHAEQQQVDAAYGQGYRLVGALLAVPPTLGSVYVAGTATLLVSTKSIWVYQVDEAFKAQVAQQSVGKTPADARSLLLHLHAGIQEVTFALQGFGSKLPADARAVHIAVQVVTGLRA